MYLLKSWAKEGEVEASLIRGFPPFPLHVLNVLGYFLLGWALFLSAWTRKEKSKKKIR